MLVTSTIPCGNGNILWYTPDHFEVEVIAYSKGPRYAYFKVSNIAKPHRRTITLRPDARFPANFSGLCARIWQKIGTNGAWKALPEENVSIEPQAIRFTVDLLPDEEYFFSTEPAREYAETTRELFEIAREMNSSATLNNIGYSIEHRPIIALRLTSSQNNSNPGEEDRPVVLITAGEHASEFSGEELVRGMLAYVCRRNSEGEQLRRDFIFDFILNTNPDGNFHGWHQYNARDWAAHNYAEIVDRSWHHEFEGYMDQALHASLPETLPDSSPETRALGNWIIKTCPTFFLSAHSWLGHGGNPGAFYTDPDLLSPEARQLTSALNRSAVEASSELGLEFQTFSSRNLCGGHLGVFLMKNNLSIAYTVEGHMNPGRETLSTLGAALLKSWLNNPQLNLRESRRPRWEAWKAKAEAVARP